MGRAAGQEQSVEPARRETADGPAVGERLRIVKSDNVSLFKANQRCTVIGTDDGIEVIFDRDGTVAVLSDACRYEAITEDEAEWRRIMFQQTELRAGDGRVRLDCNPQTYRTKNVVKRDWKGTITKIDEKTRLVTVAFDKGPVVEIDPRLEKLKPIGYEEAVVRRQKAIKKHKLAAGMVLELTADVAGEKTLLKGLRGRVTGFAPDGMVYMDWDDLPVNLHLSPDTDPFRIYDSGSGS